MSVGLKHGFFWDGLPVSPTGIINLTLFDRSENLSLEARLNILTLHDRKDTLNLDDRLDTLTPHKRGDTLTVEDKS